MKNENGITLVALAITIVVMIIIIFISVNTGKDAYSEMQLQAFEAKMKVIQEKVNLEIENYKKWEKYGESGININDYVIYLYQKNSQGNSPINANSCTYSEEFDAIIKNLYEQTSNANINNYYYFSSEDLQEILGIKDIDLNVIINFNTRNIVEKDGVVNPKNSDEIFYTLLQVNGSETENLIEYDNVTSDGINITSEILENYGLSKKIKLSLQSDENIHIPEIRNIYYGLQDELTNEEQTQNVNWIQVNDYEKEQNDVSFIVDKSGKYQFKIIGANGSQYVSGEALDIVLCNPPIICDGMKPIYWEKNESTNEVEEIEVEEINDPMWYDYSSTEKRWANAKTKDGSYWVWIPRYKYLLDSENQTSYIKFVNGVAESTTDGTNSSNYKNCPCFENGTSSNFSSGEWDKELTGIWVSKYDASREDATYSSAGSSNNIKVVPSVISFRNVSHSNMFNYCREMEKSIMTEGYRPSGTLNNGVYANDKNNIDTHLMKNSEWGAIAYLSWSKYGTNATSIQLNDTSTYITGGDTNINNVYYENNFQSNTQNLYGIYDLVGCSNEVVTAGTDITEFNSENKSTKYATKYPVDFVDDNILGDATKEVFVRDWLAWNSNNFKYYISEVGNESVFVRGGGKDSSYQGLFYLHVTSNLVSNAIHTNIGFRPVLIVE